MIWELFLYSYLITTCLSATFMPIRTYIMGKDKYGKRVSIIKALEIFMLCFIPYLCFCAMIYVSYLNVKDRLNGWVNQDPTSPKNMADPDFVPPPKKEKKFKPIKDRFDILDL